MREKLFWVAIILGIMLCLIVMIKSSHAAPGTPPGRSLGNFGLNQTIYEFKTGEYSVSVSYHGPGLIFIASSPENPGIRSGYAYINKTNSYWFEIKCQGFSLYLKPTVNNRVDVWINP